MPKLKIDLIVDDKGSLVVRRFGTEVDRVAWSSKAAFRGLASEIKVAGAALTAVTAAGGLLAAKVIDITDSYTSLESKLKLVTESSAELRDVQDQLYQIAQDSRQEYGSTVELYARMARATADTSISQRDLLTTTEAINKAMIISGATAQEAQAAMIQLSQGLASGALRGDELRSVLEQTPRVARMVADGLGIAVGQLREWGKQGKLSTEAVINAIKNQAGVINSEFAQVNVTVGQARQVLTNTFTSIINDGGQAASITETLSGAILDLSGYLEDNREELSGYFAAGVEGAKDFFAALERLGTEGKPYLDGILTTAEGIYTVADRFSTIGGPEGMEWGLIGYALLRGGPQAGALTAALITINNQLEHFNLNLGSLKTSWQEYDEAMANIMAVFRGEKDWNTGADLITTEVDRINAELDRLQRMLEETGDPVGEFFRRIFTGAEKSEEQVRAIADLQAQISRLKTELSGVAEAYDDVGGSIDDVDWEGPAPAFKRVGEAAKKSAVDVCAANQKKLTCTERTTKRINAALDKMFAQEAKDADKAHKALLKSYADAAKGITDNWQLQARDREDVEKRAMDAMIEINGAATEEMENYWSDFSENTKNILHDFVEQSVKLEFDSIGDAFDSLLSSMLDMFIDWLAKVAANWAMNGIAGLFSGQGMSGFSLSGLFGGSSGGGGGLGMAMNVASSANTVSGWLGGPSTSSLTAPASSYVSGQVGLGSGTLGANLATGAQAVYSAGTTGVGSVGSWYAGLQAAQNGVNAGTSLALIEGTYGPELASTTAAAVSEGVTTGLAEAATVDFSIDAAGGYAGSAAAGEGASMGMGTAAGYAGAAAVVAAVAYGIAQNFMQDQRNPEEIAYSNLLEDMQDGRYFAGSDDTTEGGYEPGGYLADLTEKFSARIEGAFQHIVSETDFQFAELTANLSASFNSSGIEQFLESVSGIDVTLEQSTAAMQLASEAAQGDAYAFQMLDQYFLSLGMSAEQAGAASVGLLEALNMQGMVTDETIGQIMGMTEAESALSMAMTVNAESVQSLITSFDGSSESVEYLIGELTGYEESVHSNSEMMQMATSAAHGNTTAVEALVAAFQDYGLSSGQARGATEAMIQAIRRLSATDLDLEATARLNVEVQGAATASASVAGSANVSSGYYWDESDLGWNADGGIFTGPVMYRPGQIFGEAGPEAAIPLRHPKQLNHIEDKVEAIIMALARGGRPVEINIAGSRVADVIIPAVDRHIATREARGVSGRVDYAPH